MRKSIVFVTGCAALGALGVGAAVAWRHNPRLGTSIVNSIVNPVLLRRGLAGGGRSEIGTLEHIGRRSGIRRLTPVHPEPMVEGFRIIVPLGDRSEWARNVLTAGHCRLQLHDVVYELDEPTMIPATDAVDLPRPVRTVLRGLGFEYLRLRTFAASPGVLGPMAVEAATAPPPPPVASVEPLTSSAAISPASPTPEPIAG